MYSSFTKIISLAISVRLSEMKYKKNNCKTSEKNFKTKTEIIENEILFIRLRKAKRKISKLYMSTERLI